MASTTTNDCGRPPTRLRIGPTTLNVFERPLLMGILNVTPDSFSDGGRYFDTDRAVAHGEQLVADGADWLDIGGESTRPGAQAVPIDEELRRVLPVLERLTGRVHVPVSIDTYKPEVARRALQSGASLINDVTGFRDSAMIETAADSDAGCICMHMRGTPQDMQAHAQYTDVVSELCDYFRTRLDAMRIGGIDPERVLVDPGIGFAKKKNHNLEILARLTELHMIGRPVLVGASRKRFLGELTGRPECNRLAGSIATAVHAAMSGVHVLRVHDVAEVRDALAVVAAIDDVRKP